ncbi:MAG: vitamin K epoxide reductase [Actinomycetota bacterium]|nr:vitamin K epoxide reductase [Actinomycetota bacterium]
MSDDLRRGAGALLDRRRRLAGLSLGSIAAFAGVAAYQTGVIRHLPEPPIGLLDADSVDASGEAYQRLKTPDAALGIASSAITLALIGMGDARRAEERPWVPLAMAAKVGFDALGGLYLTAEQATKHRKFCGWCLVATAAYLAMVPQVMPEARVALSELRSARH